MHLSAVYNFPSEWAEKKLRRFLEKVQRFLENLPRFLRKVRGKRKIGGEQLPIVEHFRDRKAR